MCDVHTNVEPIEMSLRGLTHMGLRNNVLDGGQDQMNPLQQRGVTTWPFFKLLWTLV